MANPFGDVVDDEKLRKMVDYVGKTIITQEDRAKEAMILINEYDKNIKAAKYLDTLSTDNGGDGISTLCLIYNATGETLYYADDIPLGGHVGRTPYPTEIGNGQWAAFQHVHPSGDFFFVHPLPNIDPRQLNGSHGAVVYRHNKSCKGNGDYLIAWSVPSQLPNKCYGDIQRVGYFDEKVQKDVIRKLHESNYFCKADYKGGVMEISMGRGDSPICRTILTLQT